MVLKIEDKKLIVSEVADVAKRAVSAGVADYRGLTVAEMSKLREQARAKGIYLKVVRNTLARRALEGSDFSCLNEALVGSVFVAFTDNEPGEVARLLKDSIKENDKLQVRALAVGGKLFLADSLDKIASLPNREQALGCLLLTFKAPITKLARTTQEIYGKLVRTVAAIRDKKSA